MILEYFLKHKEISQTQKEHIIKEYGVLVEAFVSKNDKFRDHTIKSLKRSFVELHHLQAKDLNKLSREDLVMLNMVMESILTMLKMRGVEPKADQVRHNSPDF